MSRHPSKHHAILGLDESVRLHSLPVAKENLNLDDFLDGEHLNFSDYYSDEVPYDVKPTHAIPIGGSLEEDTEIDHTAYGWWMDPNGKLWEVPHGDHIGWARTYMNQKHIDYYSDGPYRAMEKRGWIRVYQATKEIDIEYIKEPTPKQMRELKNLAIEAGKSLHDDVKDRHIEVLQESSNLKDLVTEVHLKDLYHATNTDSLMKMLEGNVIKLAFAGGTPSDQELNRGYPFFLSTMRQKYGNYARGGAVRTSRYYDVIVHLDGHAATAAGFKVFPTEYWGHLAGGNTEQEERIVSKKDEMKPLDKFVQAIHVYVDPQIKHNYTLDRLYRINEAAKKYNFPVFFYTNESQFKFQRGGGAVRDITKLNLPKVQWTPDELEYQKTSRKHGWDKHEPGYLKSFMKIYNEEPLSDTEWKDKKVMDWLLYYPHDAQAQLAAEVHNLKKYHPPIFRDIVAAMQKQGFKTFQQLVKFVIDRETEKKRKS